MRSAKCLLLPTKELSSHNPAIKNVDAWRECKNWERECGSEQHGVYRKPLSPWRGRPSGIAESRSVLIHHPSRAMATVQGGEGNLLPSFTRPGRAMSEGKPCPSKSGGKEPHDGNERKIDARGPQGARTSELLLGGFGARDEAWTATSRARYRQPDGQGRGKGHALE
ncbi:hypothetical protein BO78DRAFT_156536 [Aspergillus sclerotiicarbonarius CBS 121057]|uniref:Uncharacterized protein n=1 Tax=Aspergillus sclerotiicarbonarius (strain CBS 121057 / IBT 28362) TaxID=1448318 RepID=A0A319EAD5_ASPSB|nr:hypothetical protein BO78DRAFT_156536 [Aspergillus sclerotiicarbonarius CBS 121057]